MNLITTNLSSSAAARGLKDTSELLGRSLTRLASGPNTPGGSVDATARGASDRLGPQHLRVRIAQGNVQNAVSLVQTAEGLLGAMSETLGRMGGLAAAATEPARNGGAIAAAREEFQSLQDELRSMIGGAAGEIGGRQSVVAPKGAFHGAALFGSDIAHPALLIAAASDSAIPGANLRTGPMLDIIRQNGAGVFQLRADDSRTAATVTGAREQVASVRAEFKDLATYFDLRSATLAVEAQNLSSPVERIRDAESAHEVTEYAKYNIRMQPGTATAAQANQAPPSTLKVLLPA